MNQESEPTERMPTPEAGDSVEAARAIYKGYVEFMNSEDGERSKRQTEEMLAEAEDPASRAQDLAQLCADELGYPERTVGFLEHSDLPEPERLALLARAEDKAAANALKLAKEAKEKSGDDKVQRAISIVSGFRASKYRRRARTLREGAKALTEGRAA